eukprot:symbB.v1.2.031115.t1/scaffold3577.1/size53849/4
MARQRKTQDSTASEPAQRGTGRKASSFWKWSCVVLLGLTSLVAVLLLVFAPDPSSELVESPRGAPDQAFASAAIPLVRDFVKSNYKDYKKGKVTLRHLKQHIVDVSSLGLTYEDLSGTWLHELDAF